MGSELVWAIRRGDVDTVRRLAERADLDARDSSGLTPLIHAAGGEDRPAMVEALLEAGASPEVVEAARRDSPLHFAAGRGNPGIVERLLAHGANPNARNAIGNTPLMACALSRNRSREVADALIAAGADVSLANDSGVTPRERLSWIGGAAAGEREGVILEHPDGRFTCALEALEAVFRQLAAIDTGDRGVTFVGQGRGVGAEVLSVEEVEYADAALHVGLKPTEAAAVLDDADVPPSRVSHGPSRLDLQELEPAQRARLVDSLFRVHFGIEPFEDTGDYALGVEWTPRS